MEAYVDFPEEDIEVYNDDNFLARFEDVQGELRRLIASFKRGAILREGITCVIAGKPNVGKSSLFNTLLERDRALVSEHAGTTRDMLEESVEIGGLFIRLIDTAGLGHLSDNPLDRIGMEKTRQVLASAHLVLYVVDGAGGLEAQDREIYKDIAGSKVPVLVIINKCDNPPRMDEAQLKELTGAARLVRLSAVTRKGLDELERVITQTVLEGGMMQEGEQITRLRHKTALEAALEAIDRAQEAYRRRESLDLVTLDLKEALDQLGELIGEVYSEDLLDVIFSEFCIGK